VLVAPAEERELDADALVQALEGTVAIRREMPGHEQHRLHASAAA
jgi:hypothetical protein